MEIEIYREKEESDVIELKLKKDSSGIDVVTVNANGTTDKYICGISNDGKLKLYTCGDIKGIQTNDDGYIKIEHD